MKCHYEVLNIARDADDAEIKTAYKKMALKWHPDKNLDTPEEAKEQFQLVQQAYEVLIDKHERAWYDNHREQILRGCDSEFEDNSLNVFPYFTTTCFKGYNDEEKGFYTVYRNVFDQIVKEDMEFMDSKEELDEIPSFGNSTSDYDEVVGPFYAYWMSYSTKKSYVWLDPYDIRETRDRKILKLIEKKNQKVRLQAKKERNEEIRNLVAFVRKRDKRVQANAKKLEAKRAENRRKQEELSKQKRLQRVQELNNSTNQAEWSKFDNVQSELEQIEKQLAQEFGEDLSNSEEDKLDEEELNSLYCVACNKMFKTPKALQNHESSKKHKENVELLKQTLSDEEKEFRSDDEDLDENNQENDDNLDDDNLDEVDKNDVQVDVSLSDSETESKKEKKQKKKNKKAKNVLRVKTTSETDHSETVLLDDDNSDDDFSSSKKQKKKNKKGNQKNKKLENGVFKDEDKEELKSDNTEPQNQDEDIFGSGITNGLHKNETKIANGVANGIVDEVRTKNDIKSKNKSKNKKGKQKAQGDEELDTDHCCAACKTNFPSKNKLFEHLKTTGHSTYLPQNDKAVKIKKKLREK